jgi:hypothetical protein
MFMDLIGMLGGSQDNDELPSPRRRAIEEAEKVLGETDLLSATMAAAPAAVMEGNDPSPAPGMDEVPADTFDNTPGFAPRSRRR